MQSLSVTAPDGVSLAVRTYGNPQGRAIIFIHGFAQCHLAWSRQLGDPDLARDFHMVAYDLRGHGGSGMPVGCEWYYEDKLWADDLAAVMEAARAERAVLVAWSYGGRVVSDYVRVHGQDRLAGIVYVGAVTKSASAFWGPAMKITGDMLSEDISANIAATRQFVRNCFASEPAPDVIETILAYNMMIPPKVRAGILNRSRNEGDMLPLLRVPVLVAHGEKDAIVLAASAAFTASAVPGARLSLYEGIGHAPHIEDAGRFNRELAAFVRASARPPSA